MELVMSTAIDEEHPPNVPTTLPPWLQIKPKYNIAVNTARGWTDVNFIRMLDESTMQFHTGYGVRTLLCHDYEHMYVSLS